MANQSRHLLIVRLVELLGLPKSVINFELRVVVDEAVTVKCEFYPEPREFTDNGELVRYLGEYNLHEITPPEVIWEPRTAVKDTTLSHNKYNHYVNQPSKLDTQ